MLSTKSTILQKKNYVAKIWKLNLHTFQNIAYFFGKKMNTFAIHGVFFLLNFPKYFEYKIDHISKKWKIVKIGKMFFHMFQNIAQPFSTKTHFGHFWGERGNDIPISLIGISLIGPTIGLIGSLIINWILQVVNWTMGQII